MENCTKKTNQDYSYAERIKRAGEVQMMVSKLPFCINYDSQQYHLQIDNTCATYFNSKFVLCEFKGSSTYEVVTQLYEWFNKYLKVKNEAKSKKSKEECNPSKKGASE